MAAQMWLARSSSANALSSSATPSSSLPEARERPAAHRVRDAEELRVGDLGLERERPLRFEQRRVCVAVDLKSPGQLRQRLGEGRRVPEGLRRGRSPRASGSPPSPTRLARRRPGLGGLARRRRDRGCRSGRRSRDGLRGGRCPAPRRQRRRRRRSCPLNKRVHPAGVEGLQPHRIVALGGQVGQPLDEACRSVEVAAMAVEDGEAEIDRELFGGGGARHHQFGGARVGPLHLGCAQPARARRARLRAAAAARPPCGCAPRFRGAGRAGRSRGRSTRLPARSPRASSLVARRLGAPASHGRRRRSTSPPARP